MAAHDPLVHNIFQPAGEPPFGLIGDGAGDEFADFFGRVDDRIAAGIDDLRDDVADLLNQIF